MHPKPHSNTKSVIGIAAEKSAAYGVKELDGIAVLLACLTGPDKVIPRLLEHLLGRPPHDLDDVINVFEEMLAYQGTSRRPISKDSIYAARNMRLALEIADQEASAYGSGWLMPSHLFMGFMQMPTSAVAILMNKYFRISWNDQLRNQITQVQRKADDVLGTAASQGVNNVNFHDSNQPQDPNLAKSNLVGWTGVDKPDPRKRQTLPPNSPFRAYGSDITEDAESGKIGDTFGQDDTISKMIQVLIRSEKNNPILIGLPGTGKTAAVGALAHRINRGEVPDQLLGCTIVTINMASLVAGTKYRGEFEERAKYIIDAARANKQLIIFIDEAHNVIGAGAAEGAVDLSNILKPAMARGDIRVILATTEDEYKKHFEKDGALVRRTEKVESPEPSPATVAKILKFVRAGLEKHHGLSIEDAALVEAQRISDRFIKPVTNNYQPDVSKTLVDKTCAYVREVRSLSPEVREAWRELKDVEFQMIGAEHNGENETLLELRQRASDLRAFVNAIDEAPKPIEARIITARDVAEAANFWHGIPLGQLSEDEATQALALVDKVKSRVIGQDEPIENICAAIVESRALGGDPNKPIGSFLLLGPTGVGKTETAKALAKYLFDDERAFIKLDMSEYSEKHQVSRLYGAPPGYVGYEDGGQLTDAVRKRPFCVILLDEIEKAHEGVYPVLLQIMDDGVLTDGQGRTADFKNCVLLMTSNIGARALQQTDVFGTRPSEATVQEKNATVKSRALKSAAEKFSPEFRGRLDGIEVFYPLTNERIKEIVDLKLADLNQYLASKKLSLRVTEPVRELLFREGYNPKSGVRSLASTIKKLLRQPIGPRLLRREFQEGDTILASLEESGSIRFDKVETEAQ